MDMSYFIKIQNAYGTTSRREKELVKVNSQMSKHFEDTYDSEDVLINGEPRKLMMVKDTDDNTFKKKIKSPNGERFNLGDYVFWNNQHWLVTLLDPDEKTWNRGYMYLCTVPLRWFNSDGEIVERWCYSEDFTKYSSGVTGNSQVQFGDNQYGLTIPIDAETKKLKRDMRFPIDFDDAEEPDIYALSNRKVKLNDNQYFGRGGVMILTLSFDAYNKSTTKRVTLLDGNEVWICDRDSHIVSNEASTDNPSSDNTWTNIFAIISGGDKIRCGRGKTWAVTFTDSDGNEVHGCDYKWNVISSFDIAQLTTGNKIQLKVNDDKIIGRSFLLQVIGTGFINAETEITIIEGI